MNKIFIILFFLFFTSATFAGEKETANHEVMPMGCYVEGKKAFDDRAKVYLKEAEGVMVMYFACKKDVSDWDWYFSRQTDVNISHEQAYTGCVESAKKRKIKDCYLFAVNDTIVWGKDNVFLAQVEKEAKAKLSYIGADQPKNRAEKTSKDICIEGDCINGQGTEKYANGYTYTGQFKNGERNGQGTEKFADGYTYTGQFKNGERNGQGKEQLANGNRYVGEYKKGNRDGKGTFFWTDGRKYIGEWKKNKRHGQGTEIFTDGYTQKKLFENGITIKAEIRNFDIDKHLELFKAKKYISLNPYNGQIAFKNYDPSTLKEVTFNKKRNTRTTMGIGKWKNKRWSLKWVPKNHKSFSFFAEYDDDIKIEILIEYNQKLMKEKKSAEKELVKAEKKAKYWAKMYGQMPYFIKKKSTKKIFIHGPDKTRTNLWWAPYKKREFHAHENKCGIEYWLEHDKAANIAIMMKNYDKCSKTMLHELAHVFQRQTKVVQPQKWVKAKKLDKHYCTQYAMTNDAEDFAESLMCWVAVRYQPKRMKDIDVMVISELMKNRINYFDDLNLNAHPLKIGSSY